jgi:hypothetical protein
MQITVKYALLNDENKIVEISRIKALKLLESGNYYAESKTLCMEFLEPNETLVYVLEKNVEDDEDYSNE